MSSRLNRWDNVKAFLICCVVIGHVVNPFRKDSHLLAAMQFWIYIFHMPAFVFVAGMFSKRAVREHRVSKAAGYLMLYVLMELLMFLVNLHTKGASKAQLDLLNENNVPWFALAMCWFLLITMIVQKIPPVWVMSVSVGLGILFGYLGIAGSFLALARTVVFYPYFYMGYRTRPAAGPEPLWRRLVLTAAGVLILAGSFAYVYLDFDRISIGRKLFRGRYSYRQVSDQFWLLGGYWRLGAYLISLVLLLALLAAIPRRKYFFTKLGERTLSVYAFHFALMNLVLYGIPGCKDWIAASFTAEKCLLLSLLLILITSLPFLNTALKKFMAIPEKAVCLVRHWIK